MRLLNQMTKYFGPIFHLPHRELENLIIGESIVRYGRVRIAGGGDRIRTASPGQHIERDNTFVRVSKKLKLGNNFADPANEVCHVP